MSDEADERRDEAPSTSARADRWRDTSPSARAALAQKTRAATAAAGEGLAEAYAATRRARASDDAKADGYLLGAAPTAALLRAIEESLSGARSLVERRGVTRAKPRLLDRIASPRLSLRLDRLAQADATPRGGESLVHADTDAIAIALGCAIREVFAHDRPTTLFVDEPFLAPSERALAPLVSADLVRLSPTTDLVAASASADLVVAVARADLRATLRASGARRLDGLASDTPSIVAIVPFLYGKDELGILASHVASELLAPPGPTRGVELVIGRDWLQTEVFLERLDREIRARSPLVGGDTSAPRSWLTADGEVRADEAVRLVELRAGDPKELLTGLTERLGRASVGEGERRPLVSILTHPMLHERPGFVADLEASIASVDAGAIGVGTRASLAWSMGGPALGPSDIHTTWMLRYPSRVVVEAPLRLKVPTGLAGLRRRAGFEAAPSLGAALTLGARSLFVAF